MRTETLFRFSFNKNQFSINNYSQCIHRMPSRHVLAISHDFKTDAKNEMLNFVYSRTTGKATTSATLCLSSINQSSELSRFGNAFMRRCFSRSYNSHKVMKEVNCWRGLPVHRRVRLLLCQMMQRCCIGSVVSYPTYY